MRKASTATIALIVAIAVYFALTWSMDGLRALASPNYGLDDVWRSQLVFEAGRLLHLAPVGLIKLAAFIAAMKLAVGVICGLHILDRFRSFAGGRANSQILEGAMIVVVVSGFLSEIPATWASNAGLIREYALEIVFACLALALCMAEQQIQATEIEEPAVEEKEAPQAISRSVLQP